MKRDKHLTDEALMLLAGRRLSSEQQRTATTHLETCKACRENYDCLKVAHSVFEKLSEEGFNEIRKAAAHDLEEPLCAKFAFPWAPVLSIMAGSALILVLFFYPRTVPEASASDLLINAIRSENQQGAPQAFSLRVGGTACAAGKNNEELVFYKRSTGCNRAIQRIGETKWGRGNPLSARTYLTWHNSLRTKQNRVVKEQASWLIQTTTNEGPVHAASLEIRSSDYHAVELTLQFDDNEEMTVSEDTPPPPMAPPPDIAKANIAAQPERADVSTDLLEVQAWKLLHELNADSGWEALVLRDGSRVKIEGVVSEEERRQQLLKAFEQYPRIESDIRLARDTGKYAGYVIPERRFLPPGGPALADRWLQSEFPETDARMEYLNSTDRLVHDILGRAFFVDKLRQRQKTLIHCSCATAFSELLETEEKTLGTLQMDLSAALRPLIGSPSHPPSEPLDSREAENLDLALQELLRRSTGESSTSLNSRIQEIRRLL